MPPRNSASMKRFAPQLSRRRPPLREHRRGAWIPPLAGWLLIVVGLINIISALTPEMSERVKVLRVIASRPEIMFLQEIAIPAAFALLLTAVYLLARRRSALWVAVIL